MSRESKTQLNYGRLPPCISRALYFGFAAFVLFSCNYPEAEAPTKPSPYQPSNTRIPTDPPVVVFPEGSVPSPDGTQYALIDGGNRLVTVDSEGGEKELARSEEITHFSWFPDSLHIAYGDRVPSGDVFPMYEYRIWIASTASGETNEIAKGFEPIVSPDGGRIAFLRGGRVGDACVVGFGLGVVELDDQLRPISLLRQADINGIPSSEESETFYPSSGGGEGFPGKWRNESTLEVAMRWACKTDDPSNGVYVIDIGSQNAEKIAEYPPD